MGHNRLCVEWNTRPKRAGYLSIKLNKTVNRSYACLYFLDKHHVRSNPVGQSGRISKFALRYFPLLHVSS